LLPGRLTREWSKESPDAWPRGRAEACGEFGGAKVAYLGTARDLGVTIEIFSGIPDDRPQPEETRS
jgi:hypothetical protein